MAFLLSNISQLLLWDMWEWNSGQQWWLYDLREHTFRNFHNLAENRHSCRLVIQVERVKMYHIVIICVYNRYNHILYNLYKLQQFKVKFKNYEAKSHCLFNYKQKTCNFNCTGNIQKDYVQSYIIDFFEISIIRTTGWN